MQEGTVLNPLEEEVPIESQPYSKYELRDCRLIGFHDNEFILAARRGFSPGSTDSIIFTYRPENSTSRLQAKINSGGKPSQWSQKDGIIYLSTSKGYIAAYEISSRRVIGEQNLDRKIDCIGLNGHIYLGIRDIGIVKSDVKLSRLDSYTLENNEPFSIAGEEDLLPPNIVSALVCPDDQRIFAYYSTEDPLRSRGICQTIDTRNTRVCKQRLVPNSVSGAIINGRNMYAIQNDTANGTLSRHHGLGSTLFFIDTEENDDARELKKFPVAVTGITEKNGVIYLGLTNGDVWKLREEDGALRKLTRCDEEVTGLALDESRNLLFAGMSDGKIQAIDLSF